MGPELTCGRSGEWEELEEREMNRKSGWEWEESTGGMYGVRNDGVSEGWVEKGGGLGLQEMEGEGKSGKG